MNDLLRRCTAVIEGKATGLMYRCQLAETEPAHHDHQWDRWPEMPSEVTRQLLAAELRRLGEYRRDYCRCPKTAPDYYQMDPMALAVHEEHATAEWLADIVEGVNDGRGWMPSWRWGDWTTYLTCQGGAA